MIAWVGVVVKIRPIITTDGVGGLFEKAFHFFQFNQDEYMAKYHKRSNVESTF
jgi:hypothetical protein